MNTITNDITITDTYTTVKVGKTTYEVSDGIMANGKTYTYLESNRRTFALHENPHRPGEFIARSWPAFNTMKRNGKEVRFFKVGDMISVI